jgi:acyl-CoA thioesterase FadM
MNLCFRLLLTLLLARCRGPLSVLDTRLTHFRVLPADLDAFGHLNSGVCFQMMDVARMDHRLRSGIWKEIRRRGWFGVVVAATIQFHRELRPLQSFFIETCWIGADDKTICVTHRRVPARAGGPAFAEAPIRTLPLRRGGGTVPAGELRAAVGNPSFPQPMAGVDTGVVARAGCLPQGANPGGTAAAGRLACVMHGRSPSRLVRSRRVTAAPTLTGHLRTDIDHGAMR